MKKQKEVKCYHTLVKFKDKTEIILLDKNFFQGKKDNKTCLEKLGVWDKVELNIPIYHDLIFARGGYPSIGDFKNITRWQLTKQLLRGILSIWIRKCNFELTKKKR